MGVAKLLNKLDIPRIPFNKFAGSSSYNLRDLDVHTDKHGNMDSAIQFTELQMPPYSFHNPNRLV